MQQPSKKIKGTRLPFEIVDSSSCTFAAPVTLLTIPTSVTNFVYAQLLPVKFSWEWLSMAGITNPTTSSRRPRTSWRSPWSQEHWPARQTRKTEARITTKKPITRNHSIAIILRYSQYFDSIPVEIPIPEDAQMHESLNHTFFLFEFGISVSSSW